VGGVNVAVKDAQVMRAMLDMSTTAQIKDSLKLGREVLGRIGKVGRLHKRQVEQAGFAVLKAPDIPSILVETAFISNPEEEDKLRDPDYRRELVDALATGIQRYFARNPPLARSATGSCRTSLHTATHHSAPATATAFAPRITRVPRWSLPRRASGDRRSEVKGETSADRLRSEDMNGAGLPAAFSARAVTAVQRAVNPDDRERPPRATRLWCSPPLDAPPHAASICTL
jgi:hypothetical protein